MRDKWRIVVFVLHTNYQCYKTYLSIRTIYYQNLTLYRKVLILTALNKLFE